MISKGTTAIRPLPIAPPWHTAILVWLILLVAITGTWMSRHSVASSPVVSRDRLAAVYVPAIAVAWGLAVYVCRIGRPQSALSSLLGEVGPNASRVAANLALAVVAFALIEACELAVSLASEPHAASAVSAILPSGAIERGAWVALALSVGISEELVYRGYLRVQIGAFLRSPWLGVFLQGILFGIAHLDQGAPTAARVAVYGMGLGALASWRRTLVPGIIAHVAIDLASGLTHR